MKGESKTYFIIDFDSTFVKIEALDTLATIALQSNPRRKEIAEEIKQITAKGMSGDITFSQSLKRRLALFQPTKRDIQNLIEVLKNNVTPSFEANKEIIKFYSEKIYIISGGFKEYITPVVTPFGVDPRHILANEFTYDSNGEINGYDENNYLAQDGGKVKQVQALSLPGSICVIGDGYTDYEVRLHGEANKFIAFCENIRRDAVVNRADAVANNFGELVEDLSIS